MGTRSARESQQQIEVSRGRWKEEKSVRQRRREGNPLISLIQRDAIIKCILYSSSARRGAARRVTPSN